MYRKIEPIGLGVTRVVRDAYGCGYQDDFNTNVIAQFKKWDEKWANISDKKKSQTEKETCLKIAEERAREAQDEQKKNRRPTKLYSSG